jgi:hypothetical protein
MVIAFSDRASIVSPFTSNTSDLEDAHRAGSRRPTPHRHGEALTLAEAYMAPPTMTTDTTPVSAEIPRQARADLRRPRRRPRRARPQDAGTIERIQIGARTDNVGITALRTQRNYELPEVLNVFLTVENFGPTRRHRRLHLHRRRLPLARAAARSAPAEPGGRGGRAARRPRGRCPAETQSSVSLSFSLTVNRGRDRGPPRPR